MEIQGILSSENQKFAIIVARFNSLITKELLEAAIDAILRNGGKREDIDIIWVPGSFELASTAKQITQLQKHAAVICLGAVIKGETDHYDFVAGNAASGIANVGISSTIPVVFGVLTTDTVEQALNRAGIKAGNIGSDAAMCAIEMASVYDQIKNL